MSAKQLFGVAAACAVAVAGVAGFGRADDKPIDDEGFIRTWLILARSRWPRGTTPARRSTRSK